MHHVEDVIRKNDIKTARIAGPRSECRFMSHAHPGAGRVLPRRHLSSVQSIKSSKVNARIHDVGFFADEDVFVFPFLFFHFFGQIIWAAVWPGSVRGGLT